MSSRGNTSMIDLTEGDDDKDEFIVAADKVKLVLGVQAKMHDILEVNVILGDNNADAEFGRNQWIQLEGMPENRKMAKEYIQTLCNPIEVQPMKYPEELQALLTNPEVHGPIERHSKAVIRFEQPGEVMIYGNETLAVTLAYSALEDVISEHLEESHWDTEGNFPSGNPKQASHRLTEELKRRLSTEDGNSVDDNGIDLMNDSIKRAILDVLNSRKDGAENEDYFEAYGVVAHKPTEVSQVQNDGFVSIHGEDSKAQPMEVGPSLGEAAKQLKHIQLDTIVPDIHEKSEPDPDVNQTKSSLSEKAKYQKEWAVEKGFSEDKINAVFQKHGQNIQFQLFYRFLNDIASTEAASVTDTASSSVSSPRKGVKAPDIPPEQGVETYNARLTQDHIEETNVQTASSSVSSPRKGVKASDKPPEQGVETYIARLTQDHIEETNVQNIEELKERNEARQRLLMKIFEKRKDNEQETSDADVIVVENETDDTDAGPFRNRAQHASHIDHHAGPGPAGSHHPYRGRSPKKQHQQSNQYNQHQMQGSNNPQSRSPIHQSWEPQRNFQRGRSPSPKRYRDNVNFPSPQRQVGAAGSHSSDSSVQPDPKPSYRYVVIDGSNVAFTHGNGKIFSCRGIQLCINYFKERGHTEITAFVPQWRSRTLNGNYPISDQPLLEELRKDGHLVFTPSRRVPGKNICCYDDRYVLRLAQETQGVIVSNDNYRDLWQEKAEWRDIIENRLLMYSVVADIFMPPDDPLGKDGPTLDEFLVKGGHRNMPAPNAGYNRGGGLQYHNQAPRQPYRPPYRPPNQPGHQNHRAWQPPPQRPVHQQQHQYNHQPPGPRQQQYRNIQPRYQGQPVAFNRDSSSPKSGSSGRNWGGPPLAVDSVDSGNSWQAVRGGRRPHNQQGDPQLPARDAKKTHELRASLKDIFTDNDEEIDRILEENPSETDLNTLSVYLLN